jgi:HEPN domain-containing protein
MPNRSLDWFRQAQRDLEQAEASLLDDRHEWACFAAHQAAEKAVKALHLSYQLDHNGSLQSYAAVNYAREILEFVSDEMAKTRNR